jgi:Ca2+-transporting ATPase
MVFSILSVGPLLHSFNCRSETRSLFSVGLFSNRVLWGAVLIGLVLQTVTIYVPALNGFFKTVALSGTEAGIVLGLSAVPLVLYEAYKLRFRFGST